MLARHGISGIALGLGMLAFAAVTARPHDALASTITLISGSGGVYDYGLTLTPNELLRFSQNQTITLSDLSGVTGASVTGQLMKSFTVSSFTSTSIILSDPFGGRSFIDTLPFASTFGTLVVNSSVLTTGTVDFSMVTANEGTVTGTVEGPVSTAVPEPASLTLFGTALAGLGLIRRARR